MQQSALINSQNQDICNDGHDHLPWWCTACQSPKSYPTPMSSGKCLVDQITIVTSIDILSQFMNFKVQEWAGSFMGCNPS